MNILRLLVLGILFTAALNAGTVDDALKTQSNGVKDTYYTILDYTSGGGYLYSIQAAFDATSLSPPDATYSWVGEYSGEYITVRITIDGGTPTVLAPTRFGSGLDAVGTMQSFTFDGSGHRSRIPRWTMKLRFESSCKVEMVHGVTAQTPDLQGLVQYEAD